MTDDQLNALAGKLGERAAARLDVEATAQAVVRRLREQPAAEPSRPWWGARAVRIAAVLAVLAGAGVIASRLIPSRDYSDVALIDLTDFAAEDLQQLLATFDSTLAAPDSTAAADLEGLSEQQLREVLRSLEG